MWLENDSTHRCRPGRIAVSILLLMDVAGKRAKRGRYTCAGRCFNPSSNGCGWKTYTGRFDTDFDGVVSILLLMDVAGKQ